MGERHGIHDGHVAAAAGIALVNAVANIAGLSVPPVIGRVKDATGSFGIPLFIIAAALIAGAAVALISRRFTTPGKLADQVASSPESTSGGDPITQEHE